MPMLLEKGSHYHIYNRGNNREILFKEPRNIPYFLELWKRHITPVAHTLAYNLLPNHFHFAISVKEDIVKTPGDISRSFANMFAAYSKAINKSYERTGSLFQKNFQRKEILNDQYLLRLILYIHTNAQKHGLIRRFADYPHSSYTAMQSTKPTLLLRDKVLALFGGVEEFQNAHLSYAMQDGELQLLFEGMGDDDGGVFKHTMDFQNPEGL